MSVFSFTNLHAFYGVVYMAAFTREQITGSNTLDHLGLVASTIDKLNIIPMIDKMIPVDKGHGAKTTMGQRVSAMILNGLGFIDDRLYMFPKFLSNKPVASLLGEGLSAEYFNDDALGRCLDAIYKHGTTNMYSQLALSIGLKHNLISRKSHIDTTTLTVYGEYEIEENTKKITKENTEESPTLSPILSPILSPNTNETTTTNKDNNINTNASTIESVIKNLNLATAIPKHGHAKNHRHDLKQMTLLLATSGQAGFPIWMEAHHGNASDKKILQEAATRMQNFCNALKLAPSFLHVGDSAMYLDCVERGNNLLWLSRVPENLTIAKSVITKNDVSWQDMNNGYKIYEMEQTYKNVKQRWLLVFSEHAYKKELVTLNKNIDKEHKSIEQALWHLSAQEFCCEKDALQELKKLQKSSKFHNITHVIQPIGKHTTKGRPKKDAIPDKTVYQITGKTIKNEIAIENTKLTKGRFILATNQLDKKDLQTEDILPSYKEQSSTESGFKFIKDDTFELDSVYLKKPERINALMMIMTLCLMVYSYAQHFLRQTLEEQDATLPLQTGRQSANPSMKWIYRMFLGVHVLNIKIQNEMQHIILNLNEILCRIINYFGDTARRIYGLT